MSDYLFLYRGGDSSGSPEDMQKVMQKWISWMQDLAAKGVLKNRGEPLEATGKVVREKTIVTDGPFAESKDIVGGFSIVTADNLDQAAALAAGCPIFDVGGLVEVRPVFEMSL
jgi:hypothetical protein